MVVCGPTAALYVGKSVNSEIIAAGTLVVHKKARAHAHTTPNGCDFLIEDAPLLLPEMRYLDTNNFYIPLSPRQGEA
jgi:hypothetical protein